MSSFKEIINTIHLLKKHHPKVSIGKHIATALDGENIWGISDKQFALLLNEYQAKLDMFKLSEDNFEVDKIIEDSMDLSIDSSDELY